MPTPTFNPAYRIARCGQQSNHGPHVMEHGPDQPRNCPGGENYDWYRITTTQLVPADEVEENG